MTQYQNDNTEGATEAPPVKDANDEIIELVQAVRKRAIKDLSDVKIPSNTEKEDRLFLLAMLQGAASTAVAMKRIKAEENATQSNQAIAKSIAQAVAEARILRSKNKPNKEQQRIEQLDVELVPGQTEVGAIPVMSAAIRSMGD